ncbi:DUF4843 domain-containing protein [Pontibacter actiniarum]|uniref:DUF4843 domain-containing protein n=1 Tax=Pontibacter actiniarum TaxID=323450 RepID=A0A1X9YT30_9BACT|nr:DUF4843 domain-containing protein [Pontibacter actiniarum]ARS36008.1 DUF4843 domain-containing protein [Pontibacter actiniarum]
MKNAKTILSAALLVAMLFTSCTKEEIMPFQAEPAVHFASESVEYTFLGNPEGAYVQEVDVTVLGNKAAYDRQVNVEVMSDSLTTASPGQYELLGGVVKAGEFTGKLRVKLFNSEQLDTVKVMLHLRIAESEDFRKGNRESVDMTLAWTNKVIVPSWSYYRYFFTAKASTAAYRAIVEATGVTTFTASDYRALGATGAQALGTKFGDYVKQWNLDNPGNPLRHDDGELAGEEIVPMYYTHSKFD